MPTKYLLTCQCGRKHEVDVSQSGLELACECGQKLSVPTLRGLRALPAIEDAVARPERPWGPRDGLLLAGVLLLVAGLTAVGLLWVRYPSYPTVRPQEFETVRGAARADLDKRTFLEQLQELREMQTQGIYTGEWEQVTAYNARTRDLRVWLWVSGVVCAVGALLIVVAALLDLRRPTSKKPALG
jgi:hypothetical protein